MNKILAFALVIILAIGVFFIISKPQEVRSAWQHISKQFTLTLQQDEVGETAAVYIAGKDIAKQTSELSTRLKSINGELSQKTVPDSGSTTDLVLQRKKIMLDLAKLDPQAFLNSRLSDVARKSLPSTLQKYVEQPVTITASLETRHVDVLDSTGKQIDGHASRFDYFLLGSKKKTQLYVSGASLPFESGTQVKVAGYQLDTVIVAQAQNVRVDKMAPDITTADTLGPQKTLVILAKYLDSGPVPFSKETAASLIFNGPAQAFYQEASYGNISWTGDVVGWYTIPVNGYEGGCNASPQFYENLNDSQNLYPLVKNDVNIFNYSRFVIIVPQLCGASGYAIVGKVDGVFDGKPLHYSVAWVGGDYYDAQMSVPFPWHTFDYVLSHELGHNLGVMHANSWECGSNQSLYGGCTHQEYGNSFDVMGYGSFSLHFNSIFKSVFGWISPLVINSPGRYTLDPLENMTGTRGAYIVAPDGSRDIFLEFRKSTGFDSALGQKSDVKSNQNGLFINVGKYNGSPFSRLVDASPVSADDYADWNAVTINQGQTFTDEGRGLTIGNITKALGGESISFDVGFTTPRCIPSFAVSQFYPYFIIVKAGDTFTYNITIENSGSTKCGSSNYDGSIEMPPGWTYTLSANGSAVPVGGMTSGSGSITVPSDSKPETYNLNVNVRDTSSGITARTPFYVQVEGQNNPPPPPPPGSYTINATPSCVGTSPRISIESNGVGNGINLYRCVGTGCRPGGNPIYTGSGNTTRTDTAIDPTNTYGYRADDRTTGTPSNIAYATAPSCGTPPPPPPATLSASLSVSPSSGNAPLAVSLSASAGGTATGPLNYSFWLDCANSTTDVAAASSACGALPTPPAGTCLKGNGGAKCNSISDSTYTIAMSYPKGTFTPKVIVERDSLSAQAQSQVNVSTFVSSTITPAKTSVSPGEVISVSWNGVSQPNQKDWVAVAPRGGNWTSVYGWFHTDGLVSGSKTITMPVPVGDYDLVYYINNGFSELMRNGPVTVLKVAPPASKKKALIGVYRPSNGTFYLQNGTQIPYGSAGSDDHPAPGDYDGDGKTDIAIYRPSNGTFYISNGTQVPYGSAGSDDRPVPADYNGDGKDEVAIYRPSNGTFYISSGAQIPFGTSGDVPAPADYDGDGKDEVAIYRPSNSTFYLANGAQIPFGASGDIPIPADYDGDAKAEVAIYRPSTNTFYLQNGTQIPFGASGDIPVAGDWDGAVADASTRESMLASILVGAWHWLREVF